MSDTFTPTTRAIWLPYMKKPETNTDGVVSGDELKRAKHYQPSVFAKAVLIARSNFGCGYILNIETGKLVQVGDCRLTPREVRC